MYRWWVDVERCLVGFDRKSVFCFVLWGLIECGATVRAGAGHGWVDVGRRGTYRKGIVHWTSWRVMVGMMMLPAAVGW